MRGDSFENTIPIYANNNTSQGVAIDSAQICLFFFDITDFYGDNNRHNLNLESLSDSQNLNAV